MKHRGQILLITVMILATILTVVLSVSFRSVTETQVSKLEEENQKALAAAEAAIEASLKTGTASTFGSGSLLNITGFAGGAELTTAATNSFTTPSLPKDSSYTFYLGEYNPQTHQISPPTIFQQIEICFQSASTNPALEITLVKTTGVKKYVVDPDKGQSGRISDTAYSPSLICSNNSYNFSYPIPVSAQDNNTRLLVVRVLYQSTRLYFKRTSNFPLQGKTISSEATAQTGVSKKVILFQSYPQIPAEFFTTTF